MKSRLPRTPDAIRSAKGRLVPFLLIALASSTARAVDYQRDIKPVLRERCFACHGGLKQEAGLRLDTAALIRKGGDSGAAIVPGKVAESLVIERITAASIDERMPPEGKPLTAEQIKQITTWIAAGAPAPVDETPQKDPRRHWAFVPPVRPSQPEVEHPGWVRNPIDSFIAARHDALGLTPSPPAPKHVLLRRVYLDLIGLPPTREQLRAFLADPSLHAYEAAVDRLLESPQYGERWARHWMDVWRYSDWYGRRGQNDVRNSYPHIWRWRDWIVRSLNEDKGYDRMIVEMLAADEIAPDDDQRIAATGFIVRNFFSLNYDTWMQDLVEHTGKAFLGLRINCAHCHDHKYDPISHEDYFRFRAFFEPLELRQDRVPGGGDLPRYKKYVPGSGGSLKPIKAGLARVVDAALDAKTFMYERGDARNLIAGRPPVVPGVPGFLGGDPLEIQPVKLPAVAYYPGAKTFIRDEETAARESRVKTAETALAKAVTEQTTAEKQALENAKDPVAKAAAKTAQLAREVASARLETARAALVSIEARIAADQVKYDGAPGEFNAVAKAASRSERELALASSKQKLAESRQALFAAEQNAAKPPETEEKDPKKAAALKKQKADAVAKARKMVESAEKVILAAEGVLTAESTSYTPLSPLYQTTSTGRRTALARWIASRKNPLTARVAVNHIWSRHFGSPLVASMADLGNSGKRPSHPRLLDWLAVELMDSGWSMKKLHRLIVTSGVYRMQSKLGGAAEANLARDKDNIYLWRFNPLRMDAEVVRDSVLHVAGNLDPAMGGQEIDEKQGFISRRRSLYFSHHAEGKMKFLELFDAANPSDCYERVVTVVPHQALALTNSQLVVEQSRVLAGKLTAAVAAETRDESAQQAAFIDAAFEQVLSGRPSLEEKLASFAFLERQMELFAGKAGSDQRARESFVRALLNHNDFVTIR